MTAQPTGRGTRPVRIANCSGFFGDRLSAAREMVEGGPIDVLTGDWLAELTMIILARQRMKHGAGAGYARTFITQMEQVLGTCLERGIRVVTNAGGLDPAGCAAALREVAAAHGLTPSIAVVEGDDLLSRIAELRDRGETFANADTGAELGALTPLTANAYLGGSGITRALMSGADVVITGRVTDAALTVGPAAWWHDWSYADDLDRLAGAVVAGHVIECGAQATGGNYSFFLQVPGLERPGFPLAEVAADGSSVITKHDGTGGLVSVGTVTAQLLYEIGSPAYANPDVTAHLDAVRLEQDGPDRVRITGAKGSPAPERLKVAMNHFGGFRNSMTLVLTGLDIEAKADLALQTVAGIGLYDVAAAPNAEALALLSSLPVAELHVELLRYDRPDPALAEDAQAFLRITVRDADPKKVGKPFTTAIVESALASYPGMFPTAQPGEGTPYAGYWPTTVGRDQVSMTVTVDGNEPIAVPDVAPTAPASVPATVDGRPGVAASSSVHDLGDDPFDEPDDDGEARQAARIPLGALVGARSGDKGGTANIGVWVPCAGTNDTARADAAYEWLRRWLTEDRVRDLLPECARLSVQVYELANLRALNIVIPGLLGRGVADSLRVDPQAKGLGEHLRARLAGIPADLLPRSPIA
jgi:hypothetical protein